MTWSVIGHEGAVAILQRAIASGRLSHAYLFAGPEHVGRATTARAFAQALNCEADTTERPCGECRTCRLIAEGKHPDIEWVGVGGVCDESDHRDHATDDSRDIRVCQIRHLERVISRTTIDARQRVVIVDPADAMSDVAANAFLKTLEEPAANTILLLLTAREERLRETVRSRCRRIAFHGAPRKEIERALIERWEADPAQADRLARLSQGRLGWAVAALQDERVLIDRERTLDDIESVLAGTLGDRFTYAAGLDSRLKVEKDVTPRDSATVRASLDLWCEWWRDVLVTAAGHEDLVADSERLDTLRAHASQYRIAGALEALTAIMSGRRHLEQNANPKLAMESMLLEVPLTRSRS